MQADYLHTDEVSQYELTEKRKIMIVKISKKQIGLSTLQKRVENITRMHGYTFYYSVQINKSHYVISFKVPKRPIRKRSEEEKQRIEAKDNALSFFVETNYFHISQKIYNSKNI